MLGFTSPARRQPESASGIERKYANMSACPIPWKQLAWVSRGAEDAECARVLCKSSDHEVPPPQELHERNRLHIRLVQRRDPDAACL